MSELEPVAWMLLDAQGGAIFFRNEVSHAYAPPLYSAQTVAGLIAERAKAEQQRDDLLKACKQALYALKGREHDQFLRDAIAAAETQP